MAKRKTPKPDARPQRFRDRIVELRRLRCGDVEEHPNNIRRHSGKQLGALAGDLAERGKTRPLIAFPADGLGPAGDFSRLMFADGHGRRSLDPDEVWPIAVTDLTREEADRELFGDAIGEMAEYDPVALDIQIRAVHTGCEELQQMLVDLWDETQAEAIANTPAAPIEEDEPPAVQAVAVTRPGDLWLLGGKHRLLCGDCRDAAAWERLLGGERVNVCFTSPPYASQRKYDESSGFKPIPPDEYVAWWEPLQANVRNHLAGDGSFFVNIKPACEGLERELYVFDLVTTMRRKWEWLFAEEFCWQRIGIPQQVVRRFKNQFEPVYQFSLGEWKIRPEAVRHASDNVPIAQGPGAGDTNAARRQGAQSAVEGNAVAPGMAYPGNRLPVFSESHEALGHGAAFPVGLPSFFIRAFSDEGDIIADPFMGSFSTGMAAEANGRRAVGMELSTGYVDVCIRRYLGKHPEQAVTRQDGVTFGQAEAEGKA